HRGDAVAPELERVEQVALRRLQLVRRLEPPRAVDERLRVVAVGVDARAELDGTLRARLRKQAEQRPALPIRLVHQRGGIAVVVLERLLSRAVATALDHEDQQHDREQRGAYGEAA